MSLLWVPITFFILQMYGIAGLSQTSDGLRHALKPGFTDVPDKNLEKKRINAWLTDTAGNVYKGQLFLVTDSSLVMFTSDTLFYDAPDITQLHYFYKTEIDITNDRLIHR